MTKIKVMSRYSEPKYFEEVEEGYIYSFDDNYYRIGYQEDSEELYMVDPSGGPFIAIGYNLKELHRNLKGIVKSIKKIDKGFLLKTE